MAKKKTRPRRSPPLPPVSSTSNLFSKKAAPPPLSPHCPPPPLRASSQGQVTLPEPRSAPVGCSQATEPVSQSPLLSVEFPPLPPSRCSPRSSPPLNPSLVQMESVSPVTDRVPDVSMDVANDDLPAPFGAFEALVPSNKETPVLRSRKASASAPAAGRPVVRSATSSSTDRPVEGSSPTPAAGRPLMCETNPKRNQSVTNPPNLSWSELVHGQKKKMAKKGASFFLDSGEVCVKIPNTVIKSNKHRWDEFIIAQFSGNSPPPGTLHAIINGIWSPKLRNISVSRLTSRACLIKIPCPLTRKRVLAQGMWHVEKQAMFVAKWEPGLQPKIPELLSAPVWLEFHDVPPHFFSEEGLEYIAGLVGEPLYLHHSTTNMVNLEVAKIFTVIDPTKILPEAVNVQFESGHIHRIGVSCPWLPPICSFCKEIGHSIKRCPSAPITCQTCTSSAHTSERCPRSKKKKHEEAIEELKENKKVILQSQEQVANLVSKDALTNASTKLVTIDLTAADSSGKMEIDIGLDNVPRLKPHTFYSGLSTEATPVIPKQDTGKKLMLNTYDSVPSNSVSSFDSGGSDFSSECEEDLLGAGPFTDVLSKRSRKLLKKRMSRNPGSKQLS